MEPRRTHAAQLDDLKAKVDGVRNEIVDELKNVVIEKIVLEHRAEERAVDLRKQKLLAYEAKLMLEDLQKGFYEVPEVAASNLAGLLKDRSKAKRKAVDEDEAGHKSKKTA